MAPADLFAEEGKAHWLIGPKAVVNTSVCRVTV
jgi:hypothetical protein